MANAHTSFTDGHASSVDRVIGTVVVIATVAFSRRRATSDCDVRAYSVYVCFRVGEKVGDG